MIVVSPLYIAFVDVRQREPDDGYAQLASLLSGHRPADWSQLKVYARGWVVKAFFIPIMFVFVHTDLVAMWSEPLLPSLDFEHIFSRLMDLFYLLDVLLAVIAYALTLRLIDNHIRSTEPTVAGWVICLFCYPPFWDGVGAKIFPYDQDGLFWGKVLRPILGSMPLGGQRSWRWCSSMPGRPPRSGCAFPILQIAASSPTVPIVWSSIRPISAKTSAGG